MNSIITEADEYVVKAQILAGGRGKGRFDNGFVGGVKLTTEPEQVVDYARKMLGARLITKQTSTDGSLVQKVMVCESIELKRETYLAILLDRGSQSPVVIASSEGGVDIEEVAATNPDAIHKEVVSVETGLTREQAARLATALGFSGALHADAVEQIMRLYGLFTDVDATQVEINPLAETPDGKVYCVDAKLNFDDCAAYRQERIFAMDDQSDSDPRELMAQKYNLNYIPLDGTIACMVNGAGLAMATMDTIKMYGAEPANFLDVGGRVGEESVLRAFELILGDRQQVRAILVNIFAGIVDCNIIARGMIAAFSKVKLGVPVVVRLEGNNAAEALRMLDESKLPIETASNLDDAARKVVQSSQ